MAQVGIELRFVCHCDETNITSLNATYKLKLAVIRQKGQFIACSLYFKDTPAATTVHKHVPL